LGFAKVVKRKQAHLGEGLLAAVLGATQAHAAVEHGAGPACEYLGTLFKPVLTFKEPY
jgi:hypothetical protein